MKSTFYRTQVITGVIGLVLFLALVIPILIYLSSLVGSDSLIPWMSDLTEADMSDWGVMDHMVNTKNGTIGLIIAYLIITVIITYKLVTKNLLVKKFLSFGDQILISHQLFSNKKFKGTIVEHIQGDSYKVEIKEHEFVCKGERIADKYIHVNMTNEEVSKALKSLQ